MAVVCAGAVALSPQGAWTPSSTTSSAPSRSRASRARWLLALDAWAPAPSTASSHRSDGLEHPAGERALALALARLAGSRHPRPLDGPHARRRPALVLAALTAVAAFAALGKVLSPQFLIWLVPLAALAFAWRMYALAPPSRWPRC